MSTETKTVKSLRDRVKEFDSRLPFMEGREKGEAKDLIGSVNTIIEYGFLVNDKEETYSVIIVKERPRHFYFGGTVLTDRLIALDGDGYRNEIITEGLPVLMVEKKSKNNRTFVDVKFFPDEE